MTIKEAKKYMVLFREEWDKHSKTKNAEALDVAIKALEKQIPKKPIEIDIWGEYYECPICNKYAVDNLGCKYKFCRECGQKIDWEAEE